MSLLKVTFVEADGTEKTITGIQPGLTLMEIGRAKEVAGILGDCGGGCSCATCHVYVDEDWMARVGAADDIEISTLDMVSHVQKPNSRLSCQIALRPELDGLKVTVAPSD